MKSNQKIILEHVIEIKERLGGIEQHLKDLNGSVARNISCITNNQKSINKIKNKLAYYSGGLAIMLLILNYIFNIL